MVQINPFLLQVPCQCCCDISLFHFSKYLQQRNAFTIFLVDFAQAMQVFVVSLCIFPPKLFRLRI